MKTQVALNTARDVGARLLAMTYWGTAGTSQVYEIRVSAVVDV